MKLVTDFPKDIFNTLLLPSTQKKSSGGGEEKVTQDWVKFLNIEINGNRLIHLSEFDGKKILKLKPSILKLVTNG